MTQNVAQFKIIIFFALMGVMALIVSHVAYAQGRATTVIRDTEIEHILGEWADPLLSASGIGRKSVNLILVQSNEVNAFVAGGANLFLYTGLINRSENAGEVIGVMAHEMGHIAGGHLIKSREAMERASYESILGTVLGIGAAIATGNGGAGTAIIAGSQNYAQSNYLSHSRVNESSADQAAFSYISGAQINPSGLKSFLEKMESQELLPASQQSEYVRTHPITRNRIGAMDSLLERSIYKDKPLPAEWNEQHARMKAKLLGFISPEQVAYSYGSEDQSIAGQYARTIAAYRLNDIPTALRGIDELIKAEPDNPYFHELKGQMLVDFGRVEEGLPSYETSVKLMPDAPLLRISLAHALMQDENNTQKLREAVTHLERALIKEQRNSRAHRLMATAQGRLGHEDIAKLHLAEEAVLQNRLPYAKAQASAALKNFKAGSPEWIQAKDVLNYIAIAELKK